MIADKRLPGTIWTKDSQCKLVLGGNSSYNICRVNIRKIFYSKIIELMI